ncbi:MAG: hypothetical protein PF638_13225 [Candidatus Delongbacteria bacterium]|jgi:hypothetical protein|nr:hypothetical protein [Candidatus Delongbacteria bacterium]
MKPAFKKYISLLIIFSIMSVVYAQDIRPINNFDKLERDIPFIRDRYGKDKKDAKKRGDGFKYFMRSLLVPGWGEYKLGRKKEAAAFLITELSLIAVASGFKYYSSIREDDYKDLAVMQAGIDPSGKDDRYWIDIANYDNVEDYNAQRNINRDYENRYDDPSDSWDWSSTTVREDYDDIRISSENGNTRFYYTIGAIVLNHFVSAINASYKVPIVKTEIIQSLDTSGDIKNKLQLTYEF